MADAASAARRSASSCGSDGALVVGAALWGTAEGGGIDAAWPEVWVLEACCGSVEETWLICAAVSCGRGGRDCSLAAGWSVDTGRVCGRDAVLVGEGSVLVRGRAGRSRRATAAGFDCVTAEIGGVTGSPECTIFSFSRRRRTTEGSLIPAWRMAVVGFSSALAASRPEMVCRVWSSLMPVPFGRPRRFGVSLIGIAHSSWRTGCSRRCGAQGCSGPHPRARLIFISGDENIGFWLFVNAIEVFFECAQRQLF